MSLKIVPIRRTFFWPHPYVRLPTLWKRITIGYRYFVDGKEAKPSHEEVPAQQ